MQLLLLLSLNASFLILRKIQNIKSTAILFQRVNISNMLFFFPPILSLLPGECFIVITQQIYYAWPCKGGNKTPVAQQFEPFQVLQDEPQVVTPKLF